MVASALAGYRNVATDGVDAVLVEPGDPSGLAAALDHVLRDQAFAGSLRSAGAARAEDFSMTRLADRYLQIYESIRR